MPTKAADTSGEPLAIIGIGCRFPGGGDSPASFWARLLEGRDAITDVPSERWNHDLFHDQRSALPAHTVAGQAGFVKDIDRFDPQFFGISPREAAAMDPQHRLLMEVAWEAVDDAGLNKTELWGREAGVFVGISTRDYNGMQDIWSLPTHSSTGQAQSIAANRISYFFNFLGPSVAIDTACSSSLVALHAARQSLAEGECELALVGGVNALLDPAVFIGFSRLSMLSPDSRCRAFDSRGDGFVRAEGAGMVVLKPLRAALRDGDRVYATIRDTGVNQDGRSKGLTFPCQSAQERLLRRLYLKGEVPLERLAYVEAHGTGTAVGDPAEAGSLAQVLGKGRQEPLLVGSVKTNIGHLEAGSGIAGLIKAALVLHHRTVPPNLHFESPRPGLNLQENNLIIPTEPTPLAPKGELLAGVNSFGFGGTNAHTVLQTAPEEAPGSNGVAEPESVLLALSAASPEALRERLDSLREFWEEEQPKPLDLAHTANNRRTHHRFRWAKVVSRPSEMVSLGDSARLENLKPVFVFPGQGTQWAGMGMELMSEPVFRAVIERCQETIRQLGGWSLTEALQGELQETALAQPAIFAVQAGLVELWRSWGVEPAAVVGHSVGEVAAAYAAGVYTLEQATTVIFHRGRCMEAASPKGRMLAAALSAEEAQELLREWPEVELAALNSPQSVSLAGSQTAVQNLAGHLQEKDIVHRLLRVEYAFHSAQMEPVRAPLLQALQGLQPRKASIPLYSSVSGLLASGEEWTGNYWWKNVRQQVRFAPAIEGLLEEGFQLFVEAGTHPALSQPVMETARSQQKQVQTVASLRRNAPERESLLAAAARLYTVGLELRWSKIQKPGRLISLPTYPWQKERFWSEDPQLRRCRSKAPDHPLLGTPLSEARPVWENHLDQRVFTYLADHCLRGEALLPAAAYLEMGMALAREHDQAILLEEISFLAPCFLPTAEPVVLQVAPGDDRQAFSVNRRAFEETDQWQLLARGRVATLPPLQRAQESPEELARRLAPELGQDEFYQQFAIMGLNYGPCFQGVRRTWSGQAESLGEIVCPEGLDTTGYRLHPALLDACLQVILAAIPAELRTRASAYLPVAVERLCSFTSLPERFFSHVKLAHLEPGSLEADIEVLSPDGRVLLELRGFRCEASRPRTVDDLLYLSRWVPQLLSEIERPARSCRIYPGGCPLSQELAARLSQAGWRVESSTSGDPIEVLVDLSALQPTELDTPERETKICWNVLSRFRQGNIPPEMWLVTRDAHPEGLSGSSLWGLRRVLAAEYPACSAHIVDLGAEQTEAAAETLARELLHQPLEEEIAYRRGKRTVLRFERTRLSLLSELSEGEAGERPYQLRICKPGMLDQLKPAALPDRDLMPHEVRVRVEAASLNFSDVMKALGLYPGLSGDDTPLGVECAGRVIALGSEVSDLRVGQKVLALASHCFASQVIAARESLTVLPEGLDSKDAAALPIAFLTAEYALNYLARMRPGERVLIHSATGGVGLAAIQLAREVGAEVFATAGSSEKREYLKTLGVEHVMDSRSLAFAEEIRRATQGEGVDIILNALAGPAIRQGLSILRPFGRFLEIGKRDLYADSSLMMAPLRNNISFHAIDLDQMLRTRPDMVTSMLGELLQRFQSGTLQPLPRTDFCLSQAEAAFRFMAQAKHMGKVVLTVPQSGAITVDGCTAPTPMRRQGSYLVTGGTRGFGLATANWLAEQGARDIVLLSRAGGEAPSLPGVRVRVVRADVSKIEELEPVLRELGSSLKGVFHAAGVVHDRLIETMEAEDIDTVFASKVTGAWNLHLLTQNLKLDHFVLYSSVSSVIGPPGQAAYAAANSFMDSLAHKRRTLGLPALAVNWGHIGSVGHAARQEKVGRYLSSQGLLPLPPQAALSALGRLLHSQPQVAVADVDWKILAGRQKIPLRFESFNSGLQGEKQDHSGELLRAIKNAPPQDRPALLLEQLELVLARVMDAEPEQVDRDRPLTDFGLDSIMAYELRSWVEDGLQLTLPTAELMKGPSLRRLADMLAAEMGTPDCPETEAGDLSTQLRNDSLLDEEIAPKASALEPRGAVLLTGATGFVGSFLLREILLRTPLTVHCLVRGQDLKEARLRVLSGLGMQGAGPEAGRLKIVLGDITKRGLGLKPADFTALSNSVDAIYHSAAQVNFLYAYQALKRANVDGTREILKFACHGSPKAVHLISSIAVFSPEQYQGEVTEQDQPTELVGLSNGYSQTKWVAEQLAMQAASRGLPVTIYRPGVLVGEQANGRTNPNDMLMQLFRASLKLEKGPDLNWQPPLTPVDFAAQAIVAISREPGLCGGVYHICSNHTPNLRTARQWTRQSGFEAELVPYLEWREAMAQGAPEHLLGFLPETVEELNIRAGLRFPHDHLERTLAGLGLELPEIDQALWSKYIEYLVKMGFLSQPVRG